MPRAKAQQRKDFAESLRREMERRKGWKGRGAATKLAKAVHAKPSLAASWLRGERIPSGTYMARIMAVLGIGAAALEQGETGPAGSQGRRWVREEPSGYPSGAGDEDTAYLRTALEVSRALSNADREGLPLEAKLRLIDLAEKVMVPVYGKRATTFLDDERARLRGGEDGGGRSSP